MCKVCINLSVIAQKFPDVQNLFITNYTRGFTKHTTHALATLEISV